MSLALNGGGNAFGGSDGQYLKRASGVWAPATLAAADLPTHASTHANGGADPLAILGNQSANLFLGGPGSGSAAAPAYRGLNATDTAITPGPALHNYLAWAADPALSPGGVAPSAGLIWLTKIMVPPTAYTINTIDVIVNVAGVGGTALANCFVAIIDSSGTRQFVSADQSSAWATAGQKSVTVTGGYTPTANSYIYCALLVGTQSTTNVQLVRYDMGNTITGTINLSAAAWRNATNLSSQTSIPSSLTLANNVAASRYYWFGLR